MSCHSSTKEEVCYATLATSDAYAPMESTFCFVFDWYEVSTVGTVLSTHSMSLETPFSAK
jgi:hypothetical protein